MARLGHSTLLFERKIYLRGGGGVAGPMEGRGPLGENFDKVYPDLLGGFTTWEEMETNMQLDALSFAVKAAGMSIKHLDTVVGGDLLNQIIATNYTARELKLPFLGLYNACATMAESLLVAATLIAANCAVNVAAIASSHNSTSERQYRYPTELGVQRPQTAQWTVTGAGALIVSALGKGPLLKSATIGRVQDYDIHDPNQMGAAMAPAAFDTLHAHLQATGRTPADYDLILTGDLGSHGHEILRELCRRKNLKAGPQLQDCGVWIYDGSEDVHAGGSGAGCSASVWSAPLFRELQRGKYRHLLLIGTGALLSPTSVGQNHSIPAIAHCIELEN